MGVFIPLIMKFVVVFERMKINLRMCSTTETNLSYATMIVKWFRESMVSIPITMIEKWFRESIQKIEFFCRFSKNER